jgi:hypothetical protein
MIKRCRRMLRMGSKLTPAELRAGWHKAQAKKRVRLKLHLELLPLETRVCLAGNNWMATIPDNTSLMQMSLPGTHDSMTGSAPFTTADIDNLVDGQLNDQINNYIPNTLQAAYTLATLGGNLDTDLGHRR